MIVWVCHYKPASCSFVYNYWWVVKFYCSVSNTLCRDNRSKPCFSITTTYKTIDELNQKLFVVSNSIIINVSVFTMFPCKVLTSLQYFPFCCCLGWFDCLTDQPMAPFLPLTISNDKINSFCTQAKPLLNPFWSQYVYFYCCRSIQFFLAT